MNNNTYLVDIFFDSAGALQINCPEKNIIHLLTQHAFESNERLISFFREMSNKRFERCTMNNDKCTVYLSDQKEKWKVVMHDYKKFTKMSFFEPINKKIKSYLFNDIRKYLSDKMQVKLNKLFKLPNAKVLVAGSIATGLITVSTIASSQSLDSNIDNNFSNYPKDSIVNEVPIQERVFTVNIDDSDYIPSSNIEVAKDSIVNEVPIQERVFTVNIDDSDYMPSSNIEVAAEVAENSNNLDIENNIDDLKNSKINFSELKSFDEYNQYIKFASDLYYVDYGIAKEQVKENFSSFTGTSNSLEMQRLQELKKLGIIDGDLNVIGIFITIKDYAIDNLNLNKQEPIKSEKSMQEKEKDLIDIATNIYGIKNKDILDVIIAIHRIETHYGDDERVVGKNNLGGNMNPNSSYDDPVLNTYKTSEIGAESMIRNFLMVYSKCLQDERCNQFDPTPVFMSELYCPHSPEAWATEVSNLVNYSSIPDDVSTYLEGDSKTY